jgi:hypothetical protein
MQITKHYLFIRYERLSIVLIDIHIMPPFARGYVLFVHETSRDPRRNPEHRLLLYQVLDFFIFLLISRLRLWSSRQTIRQ